MQTLQASSPVHALLVEEDTGVSMTQCVTMPAGVLMVKHVLKHWQTSMVLYVTQQHPMQH